MTGLHRQAAGWFAENGHPLDAIRHAQEAADWDGAARLLVNHALSLTLDGEESAVHAILERFPPATFEADPELIVVRAADEIARGGLREADAYLGLAETKASATSPDRRSHLRVALAVARLSLARRRGDFTDVMQQVELLARPSETRSAAEVALSGELQALVLMNLGIVEVWSLLLDDGLAHLRDGAAVARRIGRPYLEVGCLAHLGFGVHGESFPRARDHCEEAIRLAERHGWETDPVIAPALAALGGSLAFSGMFERAGEVLDRAERVLQPEVEPATGLLLHLARGMLQAGIERPAAALARFRAAEQMQSLLVTQHALAVQVRSFRIAMAAAAGTARGSGGIGPCDRGGGDALGRVPHGARIGAAGAGSRGRGHRGPGGGARRDRPGDPRLLHRPCIRRRRACMGQTGGIAAPRKPRSRRRSTWPSRIASCCRS